MPSASPPTASRRSVASRARMSSTPAMSEPAPKEAMSAPNPVGPAPSATVSSGSATPQLKPSRPTIPNSARVLRIRGVPRANRMPAAISVETAGRCSPGARGRVPARACAGRSVARTAIAGR